MRGRLAALCVGIGCLIAAFGSAAPARAADRVYLVTYEGTYSHIVQFTHSTQDATFTDTLTWTMRAYLDARTGAVTRMLSAQGLHANQDTNPANDYHCELRPSGNTAQLPLNVQTGDAPHTLAVSAMMPAGAGPGGALTSTGSGHCTLTTVNYSQDDGSEQVFGCFDFPATPAFAVIQAVRSAPAAGYTKRLDATQTGSCQDQNGGTETATRSIHAKLIVGGGGPAAPEKPPGPSQQQRQKIFAQGDLLATLLRAQGPCGLVALGTTTVVWSSTVGGPTAPAALIPAEFLLSAGAPMCAAYATQIYLDVQIINDPPRGDVTVIARPAPTPSSAAAARTLPSCASKPAALRSFCSALRGDLAQEIAAAQRSAALAAALLTTVDRETAARRSHRGAALQRQLAAGDRLVAALRATERSQRTLGSMISGRIAAQHVTGQLTAAQDATAISALLRRLRARGVTRATLQRRAPSALTAGPYDLLAHLG